MHRILYVVIYVLFISTAHANDKEDTYISQAKNDFARKFKVDGLQINYDIKKGDLNGDGNIDFVAFAESPTTQTIRMVIFLRAKEGNFEFHKISMDTFYHENVSQSLEIKNRSLFLTRSINGSVTYGNEIFQFSMLKGKLMLVGIETEEVTRVSNDLNNDELDKFKTSGVSRNLLSRKIRNWELKNGIKIWMPAQKYLTSGPIKFEDFDYSSYGFGDK